MAIHEPECIALKRRGAQHVAQLLSGKSQKEQLAFWQKRTTRLASQQSRTQIPSIKSSTQQ